MSESKRLKDQDRGAYQRLLIDYHELEQRADMLEQKLAAVGAPGHSRSLSNASRGSGEKAMQDDQNTDFGYGSVRSTASSSAQYSRVETIDWNQKSTREESPTNGPLSLPVDAGLVLKLQQKLKDLEKENGRLNELVEDMERESSAAETYSFKLQGLELENSQLKKDLESLRKSVAEADSTTAPKTLIEQFEALQTELKCRREECIQLHTVLADHTRRMKATLGSSYGPDDDFINEDGELLLAFEGQKKINRQLEDKLQAKERQWKSQRDEWMAEIERLRKDVQQQKKILAAKLSESPQTQAKANVPQNEASKLAFEIWKLREKYEKAAEDCRKANKHIEMLQNRLRGAALPENADVNVDVSSIKTHSSFTEGTLMPEAIFIKEPDFENMSEFSKEDDNVIMHNLIAVPENADVKVEVSSTKIHESCSEVIEALMPEAIFKNEPDFENMPEFGKEDNNVIMHNFIAVPENADVKVEVSSTKTEESSSEGTFMFEAIFKKEPDFEDMSEFGKEDNNNDNMHNLIAVPEKAHVKVEVFSTTTNVSSTKGTLMPEAVCKKEREFEGMFEFRKEDINVIMRNLITELKPRVAITLLPGLPAYILFMCIRHTDCINDDDKVRAFLSSFLNTIKRVIRSRDDFECAVLWLSNTLRLLHNMKQYSGDKPFQLQNTPRQNEQCLRNFDLSEYRVVLSNVSLWIFNNVISILKERIQPLIVPALLEHEAIAGLASRPKSTKANTSPDASLNLLLEHLMIVYKTLQYHVVDPEIIVQIFKQLFYFMCASALNNLLLRNELCHWSKGMQIRFNLSHLEQWARDVQIITATDSLQPMFQAAQLLQARKTDEDVDSVCKMCNKLTGNQIIKILNLYTPTDELEKRVPTSFIRKMQEKLKERGEKNEGFLMDLNQRFPVYFPFSPSNVRLEDIEVPELLNLPMLRKV